MSDVPELWYPIANQASENATNPRTDTASDEPPEVQLPHYGGAQKLDASDDKEDVSPPDQTELAALLHERIDRDDQARYLAREAEVCNEFDDAWLGIGYQSSGTSDILQLLSL